MSKILITKPNYIFTPGIAGQGTIVIDGAFHHSQIYSICNRSRDLQCYRLEDGDLSITVEITNHERTTITLEMDTASHSSDDLLEITIFDEDYWRVLECKLEEVVNSTSIAIDKALASSKYTVTGGVDDYGLGHQFSVTTVGELQVAQSNGATDLFGTQRVGSQFNQIDIQFYRSAVVSDLVNVVAPTGTGSASIVDGGLVIATGTGANGFQRVNSYNTTTYRSGSEEYCYFTGIFTATVNANSYQRLIFGDANNGFGIGYNGTTFGVFSRYKTTDTYYTQAQFNLDSLDGSAGSKFTRAGVPEALDPTKLNVYRIRFGWVGGAPDLFEVLSPDGRWIAFHILRHPNFYTRASIANADLPITAEVSKTAGDATNLTLTSFCWGAGITGDPMVKGLTPTTVQVTNSVQTIKSGGGLLYGYQIYNPGNNTAYVHLYDTGTAITIGTTPSKLSLGNGALDNIPVILPAPIVFNNSIRIAASTAINNATQPNQPQNVTLFYQ